MPHLTHAFHIVCRCPRCTLDMHVDSHKADSYIRIVMCENPKCSDFGFAWQIDIRTGIGVSDRPKEES